MRIFYLILPFLLVACSDAQHKIVLSDEDYKIENADPSLVSPVSPSAKLALNAMPPIKDVRVQNAVVNYSDAAKAWWVTLRCKNINPESKNKFEQRLAKFTKDINTVFRIEFSVNAEQASKYAQSVQMYALEDMSANKFYGCGEQAKKIWWIGFAKTAIAVGEGRIVEIHK